MNAVSVGVLAMVWLEIVGGREYHKGEWTLRIGQPPKPASVGSAQSREGRKLMPVISIAGRNPTHRNNLPRHGIPVRSPPYLGICSYNPAYGSPAHRRRNAVE